MISISPISAKGPRISADICIGRRRQTLWFESEFSLSASAEAFMLAALPAAMRRGEALTIEAPVSARLLAQIKQVQQLLARWAPGLQVVELEAECAESRPPGASEAAFFTGGVDSFYTARERPNADLIYVYGLDIPLENAALADRVSAALNNAATRMERPLIELRTNLRSITDRYLSWQLNWGLGLASCAYVLRDHYSHFAVSTSYSDGDERAHGRELPDGGHPQILNRLNSADVNFMSVGGEARRIDKIDAIADWEVAQTALRVCWENRGQAFNCGACEKCLRTMAALAALGRLDKFDVFNRPLDCQVLARSVPTHPSVIAFAKENLATARSRNADPELIVALERYLEGPHPRYRRLWQQYAPRKLKAWLYQRGY